MHVFSLFTDPVFFSLLFEQCGRLLMKLYIIIKSDSHNKCVFSFTINLLVKVRFDLIS